MERPETDGEMFFVGMKFAPTEQLKQSDLNRIVVELFRRLFTTPDGDMLPVKHPNDPMLSLVQMIVDLDMRLDEKAFSEIPEELRRHFKVILRDGTEFRYGSKPRWI